MTGDDQAGSVPALWYFAYGSNLAPAIFLERRGMSPLAARVGHVDDLALRFDIPVGPGERGVANVAVVPGERTWGVAYQLTPSDAQRLDRSEGVPAGLYARLPVTVMTVPAPTPLAAFTYQSPPRAPDRKPSARYLALLLDGARHHRLPAAWIARLEAWPQAIDERKP